MQEARHDESRNHFQLERMSFLTDGIFAIAITILVLEFKIPVLETHTDGALLHRLSEMGLPFLGFVISFGMIAHYWSVHHRIFGYVQTYTSNLIWVNFVFIFSVVLLPFTSGVFGEYSVYTEMKVPYIIYSVNLIFIGIMNIVLWNYVSKPERKLLTREISASRRRLGIVRSLVVPVVIAVSALVALISVVGYFIPLIIPIILHYGLKKLEHKADVEEIK